MATTRCLTTPLVRLITTIACVTLPECSADFCMGVQHSCPYLLLPWAMVQVGYTPPFALFTYTQINHYNRYVMNITRVQGCIQRGGGHWAGFPPPARVPPPPNLQNYSVIKIIRVYHVYSNRTQAKKIITAIFNFRAIFW